MKPTVLGAFLVMTAALSAQGHYWVDAKNGLDTNPGTRAKPFLTIGHGLTQATSNAILHVLPGVYSAATNGEKLPLSMGDPTNAHQKVRIMGLSPQLCIIDQGSDGTSNPWSSQGKPNKNGVEPALAINGSALDVEITGLQFRNGPGTAATGWDGWWHQCVQVNNGASFIDIHHCIFYKVNRGVWMWGGPQNIRVHDNLFLSCWNDAAGSNVDNTSKNHYWYNNIFVEAGASGRGRGMWPSDKCPSMFILSNIAYKPASYGFGTGALPTGNQFENNLSFGHGTGPWTFGSMTISPTNITSDPMLVNPTADPATGDYHLKAGSPCIDTGYPKGFTGSSVASLLELVNDYYGNARVTDYDEDLKATVDIGVHEMAHAAMTVSNWGQGQTAKFSITKTGARPLPGAFFMALGGTSLLLDPYGSIGVDPGKLFLVFGWPTPAPTTVNLPIPQDPAFNGVGLYFQSLGLLPVAAGVSWKPTGTLELWL